jgi:hypothetical protein
MGCDDGPDRELVSVPDRAAMTGAGRDAADGYEAVELPRRAEPERRATAMLRRRSALPSRRAVLHVRAAGDPAVPAGLAAWCTERAFHFYLAGLRLPGQVPVGARPGARYLAAATADIDAACEHLRQADGIASIIVSAQGRSAIAAALWLDARADAADALILQEPQLPAGVCLALDIDCPVLVLTGEEDQHMSAGRRRWLAAPWRPAAAEDVGAGERARLELGRHVTWLRVPAVGRGAAAAAAAPPGHHEYHKDQRGYFDELGRWLGAYMYGPVRDQLL